LHWKQSSPLASGDRRRVAFRWLKLLCRCPAGRHHYLLQTYHVFKLGPLLRQIGELRPMNPYIEFNQEVILLCLLHLDHSRGWRRIYADDVAVVHVRR
jgi:hypothetical protein